MILRTVGWPPDYVLWKQPESTSLDEKTEYKVSGGLGGWKRLVESIQR